jgi:hypothetical protein
MTTKSLFTTILFVTICINLYAQKTELQLEVKQEDEINAGPVLKNLKNGKPDTNQVNLLVKASHIYWEQRKTHKLTIDSCLNSAQQAYALSNALQYTSGSNEAAFMLCKVYMLNNDEVSAAALLKKVSGEEHVRLLLTIAAHYALDLASQPNELAKSGPLINQAQDLSIKIHSDRGLNECKILLAKYFFAKDDIDGAKKILLENIKVQHLLKKPEAEARNWSVMAHYIPDNEDSFRFIIHCTFSQEKKRRRLSN